MSNFKKLSENWAFTNIFDPMVGYTFGSITIIGYERPVDNTERWEKVYPGFYRKVRCPFVAKRMTELTREWEANRS